MHEGRGRRGAGGVGQDRGFRVTAPRAHMAAVLRRPREPCRFRVAPREAPVAVVVPQLVGADACVRMCPYVCVCVCVCVRACACAHASATRSRARTHPLDPTRTSQMRHLCY